MPKLFFLICLGLAVLLAVVLGTGDTAQAKTRCLDLIVGINPTDGKRIFDAIVKYRNGFPVPWFTALIWGESRFDPNYVGESDDKGLGQLTEAALLEIERLYHLPVDRSRIFEIEYNLYLTGLFCARCKAAGESHGLGNYQPLYWTILTYKNWLTWDSWTRSKAQRTWDKYQELKYGYYSNKYDSEVL